jgi:periodic tryptophan protein 1
VLHQLSVRCLNVLRQPKQAFIQVWDLTDGSCQHTVKAHKDKVQALAWNPSETQALLSGGFDKQAIVSDMRAPGTAPAKWKCTSDVESLSWSRHQATQFIVSLESGDVLCFDTRRVDATSVWTLKAHDKPATSVAFNPVVPNVFVTGSVDKTVCLSPQRVNSSFFEFIPQVCTRMSHEDRN